MTPAKAPFHPRSEPMANSALPYPPTAACIVRKMAGGLGVAVLALGSTLLLSGCKPVIEVEQTGPPASDDMGSQPCSGEDGDGDGVCDHLEPAACRSTASGSDVTSDGCELGDFNKDGCVTMVDALRAKALAKKSADAHTTLPSHCWWDADDDGVLTDQDAEEIKTLFLSGESTSSCADEQAANASWCDSGCKAAVVCAGMDCGDDGCGGTCGACSAEQDCISGRCDVDQDHDGVGDSSEPEACRSTPEGTRVGTDGCHSGDVDRDGCVGNTDIAIFKPIEGTCLAGLDACGFDLDGDGCFTDSELAKLVETVDPFCEGGIANYCDTECAASVKCAGKDCGEDGCSGTCGACEDGQECVEGSCN